jgi:putative ABC transport system permease protein
MNAQPPRLFEALLSICLPPGRIREGILGDQAELHERRIRTVGPSRAQWAYATDAAGLVVRYLIPRIRKIRFPKQRHPMDSLFQDLRVGVRALFKQPGSTALSVLAFGLGIGLCTTMFSIMYGIYGRGIGVPEADRLVVLSQSNPSRDIDRMEVPLHDLYDWREEQRSFEGLGGFSMGTMNLSDGGDPERFDGAWVSANAFDLLQVQPVVGRAFQEGDDGPGAPLTVVLGHDLWETRYHSDPNVVGRTVKVNGEQGTIIGVMPDGFFFPTIEQIWIPRRDERGSNQRGEGPTLQAFGRLRAGVTEDQAQLEMSLIAQRLAAAYPESNEGVGVTFNTFVDLSIGPEAFPVLVAMQIATILVLLIACANVANLLLARATLRTKEAAVRTAVGASRLRVALPFITESGLMAVAGAALGIGIAYFSVNLVEGISAGVGKPPFMALAVDLPILGFVVGIALLTALASGAAPAIQVSRADANSILKDQGRGSSSFRANRLSKVLVISEIAMSCVLLVAAGLMTKSITNLRTQEFGFTTENIFTARIGIFEEDFPTIEDRQAFYRDLQESLSGLPRARSVALTDQLPGVTAGGSRFGIEGETYLTDQDYPLARMAVATPGLFATFGAGISQGRDFGVEDHADAPAVVIVNQRFAERFFPDDNPIGRRMRVGASESQQDWGTIVGVVPNLRMEGFASGIEDPAGFYLPLAQSDRNFMSMAIQVAEGDPLSLAPAVREAVRAVHPDTPIYRVWDMAEVLYRETWFFELFGGLFIAFGVAALFLASVGLYGVIAFSVSRRVQEMGIRMALGADAGRVIRLVLREGTVQLGVGLAIGLALALTTSSVLANMIFDVQPRDPVVFGAIVGVIVLVGLCATLVPAYQATRVAPVEALK